MPVSDALFAPLLLSPPPPLLPQAASVVATVAVATTVRRRREDLDKCSPLVQSGPLPGGGMPTLPREPGSHLPPARGDHRPRAVCQSRRRVPTKPAGAKIMTAARTRPYTSGASWAAAVLESPWAVPRSV